MKIFVGSLMVSLSIFTAIPLPSWAMVEYKGKGDGVIEGQLHLDQNPNQIVKTKNEIWGIAGAQHTLFCPCNGPKLNDGDSGKAHKEEVVKLNSVEIADLIKESALLELAKGEPKSPMARFLAEELYNTRYNAERRYRWLKEIEGVRLEHLVLPEFPLQTQGQVKDFKNFQDVSKERDKAIEKEKHPYMVMQYKDEPIFFMGFANSEIQGLAFDRLNIFVEVNPGLVATDEELDKINWELQIVGGDDHDYRLSDITKFFTEADKKGIKLNAVEERIREELIQSGLLIKDKNGYRATKEAAIISTDDSSEANFDHEFNHAIYFTDRQYRNAAINLWKYLSDSERALARDIMQALFEYNFASDEDLLIREFIAFFRDFDELVSSYLSPLGNHILQSKQGEALYSLRSYYDSKGKLLPGVRRIITSLSEAVKSIDSKSRVYRDQSKKKEIKD